MHDRATVTHLVGRTGHALRTSQATEIFTLRTFGKYGNNMDNYAEPNASNSRSSIDANREMEYRLNSLHALVCDLLKTNQELRGALEQAREDVSRIQGQ